MNPIVGVDIGGTKMLMVTEIDGQYIEKRISTGINFTKYNVKNELENFISQLPFVPGGIGIAIPGLVKDSDVVEISDVLPKIKGMNTEFLKLGDLPVYFINDVKTALVHESQLFNEKSMIVVIMVGTGIGMAIKEKGQFITGCKDWAGEFGSIPIQTPNGVQKLDELASGASILEKARTNPTVLMQQLEAGNKDINKIIHLAGEYLGLGIATIINMLNPEIITLYYR